MRCVIAASAPFYRSLPERVKAETGAKVVLVTDQSQLTAARLAEIDPRYVFLAHWSHIVPDDVWSRFECVVFHMTDLPFGRGGSPLQNLVERGVSETVVSALRCERELDAGPIYGKRPLCLGGRAEEIYLRAADVIQELMVWIIREQPEPAVQSGVPVAFSRRGPQDSDMAPLTDLGKVFDHIRMLDADGYPKAFVQVGCLRFEFTRAALHDGSVDADVRITCDEDTQ